MLNEIELTPEEACDLDEWFEESGKQKETRPDLSDNDLKKMWKVGEFEDKDEEMRKSLSKAELTLEDKLANLLDKSKSKQKKYDEVRQKAIAEEMEKLKKASHEHASLQDTLHMLKTIGSAFLVGPTGTGKSTLAKSACKSLFDIKDDVDPVVSGKYAQISFSPDTTSGEMIGRTDVNGKFHESEIVRVYRDGGLILFDEIDDADPSMLIKVNTALANGYLATPEGMVTRNKDTYIVCAANTFGTGPDAMYVGRTRLDAATLDRFCLSTIYVDYDTHLEDEIASALDDEKHYWLTGYVQRVRDAIKSGHLRRACSTRFVINAVAHMKAGKTPRWVVDNFLQGWTQSERSKIKDLDYDTGVHVHSTEEDRPYSAGYGSWSAWH